MTQVERPSEGHLHDVAARGFGSAAREYDRARPDYPEEAIDRLVQQLEIAGETRVLDVAAGTGRLTRMLVPTRARVVAVEPVEAMRTRLARALPEIPVVAGLAEALPFSDEAFDAVVVGQAFHWFDGRAALSEIHRILRPHGRLALVWNVIDASRPWAEDLWRILEPRLEASGAPNERTGEWRAAFAASDDFGMLHQLRFTYSQSLGRQGLFDRVASASFVASLPQEGRTEVLEEVGRLADTHPETAGQEHVVIPYVTELYWCSKA